jgi:hypothetical protein
VIAGSYRSVAGKRVLGAEWDIAWRSGWTDDEYQRLDGIQCVAFVNIRLVDHATNEMPSFRNLGHLGDCVSEDDSSLV